MKSVKLTSCLTKALINCRRILRFRKQEFQKFSKAIVRITADTALRLAKYFGTSAKFWLGLQNDFDLEEEQRAKSTTLKAIVRYNRKAA